MNLFRTLTYSVKTGGRKQQFLASIWGEIRTLQEENKLGDIGYEKKGEGFGTFHTLFEEL